MARPWILDYDSANCTIGATVDILGERPTFLVLREAFNGVRRFDDMQRRTGMPRQVLSQRLSRLVDEARTDEPEVEGTIVIHRPMPEGFAVERVEPGVFRVVGKVAERAVALNDVTTDEAADFVQGRLRRLGVDRALTRAGARDGDVVHIGELAFTWYRDQPEFIGDSGSRRRRPW